MTPDWFWIVVAAGPGWAALLLLFLRRSDDAAAATEMEALRGLSRDMVEAEMTTMRKQMEQLERRSAKDDVQFNTMREELDELWRGVSVLTAQLRRAGMIPEWTPPRGRGTDIADSHEPGPMPVKVNVANLRKMLAKHFNQDELEDLVLELGVDGAQVWSDSATVPARARALVDYAERHGMLERLVALCRTMRENVVW